MTKVYVTRKANMGSRVYHTNEDCHKLDQSDDYRTVERNAYPNLKECAVCAGTVADTSEQSISLRKLLEMGEVDEQHPHEEV